MHGIWESAEALVVTPNQQLQQPSRMMEDNHPLHSPTPPAWGIADSTVKEEPTDDKNNDSGVSPGHYTSSISPGSRRSSFTATGSLSPGSVESGDSQSNFKSFTSPLDFSRVPGLEDLAKQTMMHRPMDVGNMNAGSDASEGCQDHLQCPVCHFTTQDRLQFREHLTGHYESNDSTDYPNALYPQVSHLNNSQLSPMDDSNRASPMSGSERSDQDCEETDEPGIRTPRVNSQGKVKTFRCKQCNFVAVTKLSFWEHTRGHIKAEKLLTCPKCPFVTELKHHLEYHLRNHLGSKPFQCDKCSYSCVSKSMLSSHLKSHSNVYQYRCANCPYRTKYQHSLKLHLKNRNHEAGMVLNPDGTPNPHCTIDVYGTRRGPKAKPIATKPEETPGNPQSLQMMPQMGTLTPLSINNGFNPMMAFNPFNSIFSGFPVVNGFGGDDVDKIEGLRANILAEYATAMVADRLNANLPRDVSNYGLSENVSCGDVDYKSEGVAMIKKTEVTSEGKSDLGAPLDLSKPEISVNNNNNEDKEMQEKIENSPRTGAKSRRKGKALKLNRQIVESEEEKEVISDGGDAHEEVNEEKERSEKRLNGGGSCSEFTCQFCEIVFGNEVMYSVHMGYHGFSNPFTCNMCGHECDDKVSFFLHIARVKHA
uniref:Protein hunchback n=1 Tax=Fopius arisanus TaxID=64838 RepID=A0A0C9R5B5_9HYME